MRMKLAAPYFSSHCPTLKTHEFSSGSSPERRAAPRHRIRCLIFNWFTKVTNDSTLHRSSIPVIAGISRSLRL
jgi:hypothetical protein